MSPHNNLRRIGIAIAAAVACLAPATPASATLTSPIPTSPIPTSPIPTSPIPTSPIPTSAIPTSAIPTGAIELSSCSGAYAEPTAGNLPKVRRATLCLLNEERTQRSLGRLRSSRPLKRVAQRYARRMATRSFFDHVSPAGSTFVDRIKQSNYLDAGDSYNLGENLGWGGGPLATPERIVRAWMDSPGHRANILNGRFRDIGVGVVVGVPVAGGDQGATYVNEFGTRS